MKDGLLLPQGNTRTRTRVVPFDTWDPRRDPPPEHQLVVSPRSGDGDETDEEPLADTVAIAACERARVKYTIISPDDIVIPVIQDD